MVLPVPRFNLYYEEYPVRRLVLFCFCAAAALANIPTGISRWEDELSIKGIFNFNQTEQVMLLELPGFAAPDSNKFLENNASGENGGTETEEQQGANTFGEGYENDFNDSTADKNTPSDDTPAADNAQNSSESDSDSAAASGSESGDASSEPNHSDSSSEGSSSSSSGASGPSDNSGTTGADSGSSSSSDTSGDSGSSSSSGGSGGSGSSSSSGGGSSSDNSSTD